MTHVQLHYTVCGQGSAVVLLHGLFGAGDNLGLIQRRLAQKHRVFAVDLRNHGRSPHADTMSLPEMAEDLNGLLLGQRIGSCDLLGHSLGGKVAMQFALTNPSSVRRLVVVDIATKQYPPWHRPIIDALLGLPLDTMNTREQLDAALAQAIPQKLVRQFLLKSVERTPDGNFRWRLNLSALNENLEQLNQPVRQDAVFRGPVLFIKGGKSDYIAPQDEPAIKRLFPCAQFQEMPEAGHWVHSDAPDAFAASVVNFFDAE